MIFPFRIHFVIEVFLRLMNNRFFIRSKLFMNILPNIFIFTIFDIEIIPMNLKSFIISLPFRFLKLLSSMNLNSLVWRCLQRNLNIIFRIIIFAFKHFQWIRLHHTNIRLWMLKTWHIWFDFQLFNSLGRKYNSLYCVCYFLLPYLFL